MYLENVIFCIERLRSCGSSRPPILIRGLRVICKIGGREEEQGWREATTPLYK
ncbi:MAG TPA: hypothetical protein [Caudoviricetes sp.]|nr:MAG TPA: hypothetical protein [Caudoviricetes sp.]